VQTLEKNIEVQLGSLGEAGNAVIETVIRESQRDEIWEVRSNGNLIETVKHSATRPERKSFAGAPLMIVFVELLLVPFHRWRPRKGNAEVTATVRIRHTRRA
jgi:hypothetical protein